MAFYGDDGDDACLFIHFVYDAVFGVNAPGPAAAHFVSQGFGFAEACIRSVFDIQEEAVDFAECVLVRFAPVEYIVNSLFGESKPEVHVSRDQGVF